MTDNLEIERRLDRYAKVRLSPDPDAVARMRARVMRDARLEFAARAERRIAGAATAGDRATSRVRLFRRAGALLAAAVLSVGVAAGALAASQPGGPLYGVRVSLETLALPTDTAQRGAAELTRLEARVHEILAAASSGDQAALQAALAAYETIADEALAGAGDNAALLDRIRLALSRHVAILQGLTASLPEQAREAIQLNIDRAIEHNGRVIDRIDAASQPGGGAQPGAGPAADRTPRPTKPPKPAATPAPATTSEPAVTPGPVATPQPPAPTEKPAGPPSEKPDKTPPGRGGSAAP